MSDPTPIGDALDKLGFTLTIPDARSTNAQQLTRRLQEISDEVDQTRPMRSYFRMGLLAATAIERVHLLEQEAQDARASDTRGRGSRSPGGGARPAASVI